MITSWSLFILKIWIILSVSSKQLLAQFPFESTVILYLYLQNGFPDLNLSIFMIVFSLLLLLLLMELLEFFDDISLW